MHVIRENKKSILWDIVIIGLVALLLFHTLEVYSNEQVIDPKLVDLTIAHIFKNPFSITFSQKNLKIVVFLTFFIFAIYKSYTLNNKRTIQNILFGSSEWGNPKRIKKLKDKNPLNNLILTNTEQVSYNMRKTNLNRNVAIIGSPGTGKSRYYMKPNIMNANGSMVITDPKGELLHATGSLLVNNGYRVKVLNLDNMFISNHYNPLAYIKKMPKEAYMEDFEITEELLREDDVMALINLIMINTDGEMKKQNKTGDPFWEKAEMLLLQSCFFYVLFNLGKPYRNLTSVIKLLRKAKKDEGDEKSELDILFDNWKKRDPNNIGVKQYDHYKSAASKMERTIIMTAVARLSIFNITALSHLTNDDDLCLNDFGAKGDDGKIALFIVTKPANTTFNFLAAILYTQLFQLLDTNATKNDGELPTPVNLYIDEFANIGEIPRFLENLAYVRGLNVGVTFAIQSLKQLEKLYKDDWETALDCCDYILFLGAKSKTTLQWVSDTLGKKTWNKKTANKTYGRRGSNSVGWDVTGRELATPSEISKMKKGFGILFIAGQNPFYSRLYNLKKHPRYKELYEPWNKQKTIQNYYDHSTYLKDSQQNDLIKQELESMGISGKIVDIVPQNITLNELKKFKMIDINDI